MHAVILDASVAIAALFASGRARHVITHAPPQLLHAPIHLISEVERALPRISRRASITPAALDLVLDELRSKITLLPSALLAPFMEDALDRCKTADALGDEAYVAAALALDAPVWTYDMDFRRVSGIKLASTTEVEASSLPF